MRELVSGGADVNETDQYGWLPVHRAAANNRARACLEVTDVGRLALAVLDGGVFAPRRALELAKLVHDAAAVTSDERVRAESAVHHD